MARSHVKELAREAFELDEVVLDSDGDLPFPYGTAMTYVSVIHGGHIVRVWSWAVLGLQVGKAVRREIDDVNGALTFTRVLTRGDGVIVEGCLPVESMSPRDLFALVTEVGRVADRVGPMLAAVHGGRVHRAEGAEVDVEHED